MNALHPIIITEQCGRNELIAEMFHKIHLVEKWGRGISLILSKEPDADFKEYAGMFFSVFSRKHGFAKLSHGGVNKLLKIIDKNHGLRLPQLASLLNKPANTVDKWIRKLRVDKKIVFAGAPKSGGYFLMEKNVKNKGEKNNGTSK